MVEEDSETKRVGFWRLLGLQERPGNWRCTRCLTGIHMGVVSSRAPPWKGKKRSESSGCFCRWPIHARTIRRFLVGWWYRSMEGFQGDMCLLSFVMPAMRCHPEQRLLSWRVCVAGRCKLLRLLWSISFFFWYLYIFFWRATHSHFITPFVILCYSVD